MAGGLSEAEAALVRRWARRQRNYFWLLLPLWLPTSAGLLVIGAVEISAHLLYALASLAGGVGLALMVWALLWQPARTHGRIAAGHPVRVLRGVYELRASGRVVRAYVGGTAVVFASSKLGQREKRGRPVVARAVMGAPVVVVALE
jgi:hypothetical protein